MSHDVTHFDSDRLPDGLSLDDVLAYTEDALSPADAARVETMLAAQPTWQAQVRGMRSDRSAVRSLTPATPMNAGLAESAVDAYVASLVEEPLPADVLASIERARESGSATPAAPVVVRTRGGLAKALLGGTLATRAVGWSLAAGVMLALGLGLWTVADRINDSIVAGPQPGGEMQAFNGANSSASDLDPLGGDLDAMRDRIASAQSSQMARSESRNAGDGAGRGTPIDALADGSGMISGLRLASMDEAAALAEAGRLMIVVSTRRDADLERAWLDAGRAASFAVEPESTRWAMGANSALYNPASASIDDVQWAGAIARSAMTLHRATTLDLAPGTDPQALASGDEDAMTDAIDNRKADNDDTAAQVRTWTASLDRETGLDALARAAGHAGARVTLLALPERPERPEQAGSVQKADTPDGTITESAELTLPVAPRLDDLLWWELSPKAWSERVREAWLDVPVIVDVRH